jgi:hypothetical protein
VSEVEAALTLGAFATRIPDTILACNAAVVKVVEREGDGGVE